MSKESFQKEMDYFLDKYTYGLMKHRKKMVYEPLKITFRLSSPISLTHPWMHFDGLVGHLLTIDALGKDFFLLPRKFPLSRLLKKVELPPFPIKRYKDVYHASVSIFDSEKMALGIMYKRFEDRWAGGIKKIRRGSGHFKDYAMQHIYIPTRSIIFYVCADKESMKELCPLVTGLGDNIRIGWGRVQDFKIESISEDYGLIKDGKATRPIPISLCKYAEETIALAYKPPYWAPEHVAPCCPPHVKVELKE